MFTANESWIEWPFRESKSELQSQSELHNSSIAGKRSDRSRAGAAEVAAWESELDGIREIEYLPAKFESDGLANGKLPL